ncbi:MAG: M48 family metalloprotease [Bacteroidaceae bacterium]|nr:M48 family metalloprotease [Bacteroidaceae bacterium]
MKKYIIILLLSITTISTQAQTNWISLAMGALKIGKALSITDEEFAALVKESVVAMDNENSVCDESDPYTKRLRRITEGLTDADGIALNFKVYRTNNINAFACPDGSVRVYSALMDLLNDDELLGVIGHEVGHVALRHSKKAWKDEVLRSGASEAIGTFSSTWASLSSSVLGDIAEAAISAKFSRSQENKADDYGYEFLKKSNKNPWAMGEAFKKMKELEGSGDSQYNVLLKAFASHPDFDKRIERMRKKAQKDGYPCM